MLRFVLFCVCIIAVYAIYVDVTKGTLPLRNSAKATPISEKMVFYTKEIKPGDTVLSIVEHTEDGLPAPIGDIVSDFEALNNGLTPEKILIGKTYNIPDYQ